MLLTEQEAKEKWCLLTNTGEQDDPKCAGPYCMAWRWGEEEGALSYDPNSNMVSVDRGPNRKGFCGLAGAVAYT